MRTYKTDAEKVSEIKAWISDNPDSGLELQEKDEGAKYGYSRIWYRLRQKGITLMYYPNYYMVDKAYNAFNHFKRGYEK